MQKQLLEQVQKALQAQQDTISRQNQMLDDKDKHIAQLTQSLNKLALTKTQQLEELPNLFNTLTESIEQHTKAWQAWKSHQKEYGQTQSIITEQLTTLANAQNRLAETLKEYQLELTPTDTLTSDTEQLESKLSILQKTQQEIDSTQSEISKSQKLIQTELDSLNSLINK